MYCLNLARTLPNYSAKYEIQDYLRTEVDTMNHQEASIVAMSCFKTETNIDDPVIVEKLLNIAISARQEIDYISISAVAKFARFTSSPKLKPVLIKLQEAFLPELGRLNVHSSVHLALVGTKTQLAHKPLLNAVVEIIQDNIESARLKDLERIALVMTMFDVDCDKLGWLIVEELASPRRTEEIKEYGRCLPAILHYLSIREIFPQNLINYVLGEKFVQTYYANTSEIYLRELLCLDFCAELEIVGYTGARLDKIARDKISKGHISRVSKPLGPKLSAYEVSLRKLTTILESFLGGPEYCVISNILPHHHCKKIIFCTDATGKPSPIPHHYRNLPEHEIKYLNGGDLQFHVMYACNRSDFIPSEKKLTGSGNLIIRQLKKLGYRVHVIFPPFTVTQVNDVMQKLL
ncbi:FAST kinase domain-containing protein 5, mitochondrial isoform X2 [Folsomia candida]|nr:FAST kinase domain-containing protein 5, mitochondrial isoform X2 [Folsomia candida]